MNTGNPFVFTASISGARNDVGRGQTNATKLAFQDSHYGFSVFAWTVAHV
jgi:hypothetical protein